MTYEDIFSEKGVEAAKKRIQDLSAEHLKALEKDFEESTKFLSKTSEEYKKAYKDFEGVKLKLSTSTEEKIENIQKHYIKNTSYFRKRQILRDDQEVLREKIRNAERERDVLIRIQKDLGQELTSEQDERLKRLKANIEDYGNQIKKISRQITRGDKKIEQSDNDAQKKKLARLKKYEEASKKLYKAQVDREADAAKLKKKLQKDLNKSEDLGFFSSKKAKISAYMQYGLANLANSVATMSGDNGFETAKNIAFEAGTNLANIGSAVGSQVGDLIKNKLKDTFTGNAKFEGINAAIQDVTSHRTKIMARLQNEAGEYDYAGLLDTIAKNLAVSPYITQKAFMQKLDEAVDKGIAYNVEQRAFLSSIKDDIATTFDAFDSNLMRIVRLQQADSTAARLGMEAALTKTFNTLFSDTSYLSDVYDSITAAIVDSEALMTRDAATEFEYVVQKWMGALYSLGASNELISQIAQGLNYIGTGNVQALASNSPLQTLFAMSASRASNVDYADLLVGGLTTTKTNDLLKAMVEYLKEIAEDNKNNNVVKAAYGDIYKMSLADMRAITSLSESDISSIYSQTMSYSDMQTSLNKQLSSISKRLSVSEMISNVMDNFVYSLGSEIAQNAVSYTLWQITDLIQNETGGLHIPAISVFGNMVDLSSFTIEGMMKTTLVGLSTLGQIGNIISSLNNKGGLSLGAWNYQDTVQRGQIEAQNAGSISNTSGSMYVSSSSSSDMKKSSIAGATEDSKEVAEITNADNESEYTFDDWYKAVLIDHEPLYTKLYDSGYTMDDFYRAVLLEHEPLYTFSMNSSYSIDDIYKELFIDNKALKVENYKKYVDTDLYKAIFKDNGVIPVEISKTNDLGIELFNLISKLNETNRVTDINIKSSDINLPISMNRLDDSLKEKIKLFITTTYIDLLSSTLRESLIGQSRGASNVTIANICDKIMNDKIDVEVKNNNFDNFLDVQSSLIF